MCLAVGVFEGDWLPLLPWVTLVVLLELLVHWRPQVRGQVLAGEVLIVVISIAITLPDTRALLPVMLVPAFRAGETQGRRVAAWTCSALLAAPASSAVLLWQSGSPSPPQPAAVAQWWLLAVGIAVLAAWNRRVEIDRGEPQRAIAREAGQLLGRLQDLARALPAGLDAPAVSQIMLDGILAQAPADRCAVLVRVGVDQVSPVALRGVERVPWRDPIRAPGSANRAWTRREVVVDQRSHDDHGRRAGSSLLCVPVADRDDELLGLVVIERLGERPFTDQEISHAAATVERMAPNLHAALAFTELRHLTEITERERLAREMHDGVAQDLSAIGFMLDVLVRQARSADAQLAEGARAVRAELNRVIRDIRLSIADLRSSAQPDRGLGPAVSSHVESLAAATGIAVTLSLQESSFRLPSHVESALLRLIQDFLADVRGQSDVRRVDVTLTSHAPEALVELSREGGREWHPDRTLVTDLESRGGSVTNVASPGGTRAVLRVDRAPASSGRLDQLPVSVDLGVAS